MIDSVFTRKVRARSAVVGQVKNDAQIGQVTFE